MGNLFLSFLGTSEYLPCNYVYKEKKAKDVQFVQEGLLSILLDKFSSGKENRVVIFLTDAAREKNWETRNDDEGLYQRLLKIERNLKIEAVRIPEGNSEKGIWEIFKIVFDQIHDEDGIYLDVTHGFRSLPMLAMVLLNYARFLKGIKVKGIYYGAFESLGAYQVVKNLNLEERNVPIFDLTPFHTLQRWSGAVENFEVFGDTQTISSLLFSKLNQIIKSTDKPDKKAFDEKDFAKGFGKVGNLYSTVRGKQLYKGDEHNRLKQQIEKVSQQKLYNYPLSPLLNRVQEQLSPYKMNSLRNCFLGVGWCLEHGYIQQGITLLQETIISAILDDIGEDWSDESNTKVKIIEKRRLALSGFIKRWNKDGVILGEEREAEYFSVDANTLKEKLQMSAVFEHMAPIYEGLRDHRNNINHAGYLLDIKAGDFSNRLRKAYK
ncbi:MAG TPA: TIGR02221 family CRISPR-associated protein, partial [Sediminispirochaeta sp.]|nr:TIGR02221 family CRISPR-associated protein [Sediminispirochaeta sp.]